jgi:hypothetical protein
MPQVPFVIHYDKIKYNNSISFFYRTKVNRLAMQLWIKNDALENIKKKAMNENVTRVEFKDLVDTLKSQGKVSMYSLSQLLYKPKLSTVEMQYVNETLRELSG